MNFNVLHNFISPVTGRVLSDPDYVLVGDRDGVATPSPILVDTRLELIDLKKEVNDINALNNETDFVIGTADQRLPKAQALNELDDGFVYNTGGVVSTTTDTPLPNLPNGTLWIGDALNRPSPSIQIDTNNLPNITSNKVWQGNSLNRPVEVELNIAPDDAKYIIQQENSAIPNAQILGNLSTGILKNTSITGILTIASGGGTVGVDDYVTPLALDEAIEAQAAITTSEIAASAVATEAAAYAAFQAEMLPFVGLGVVTIGEEILATITAEAAGAVATANIHTNTQINNLTVTLAGDINGSGLLSSTINTTFVENPVFSGQESITIPYGTSSERPINAALGMLRINTDL